MMLFAVPEQAVADAENATPCFHSSILWPQSYPFALVSTVDFWKS